MLRVLGFAFVGATFAPPPPPPDVEDAPAAATAPADEGTRRTVGVVTFEGTSAHAATLCRALSAALRERGHWVRGGRSLQQVQSELQCTNYEPACMAGAAKLFESELVIYGTLRADGSSHQLEMVLLDGSRGGEVQSHVSATIREHELSDASIEGKATDLLAQLWPLPGTTNEVDAAPAVPPAPIEEATPVFGEPPPPSAGNGRLRWGRERPAKPWKWVGLGTSAGVLGLGAVLAIVGAVRLRQPGGPLERELFEQADESLVDTFGPSHPMANELNTENDIDRSQGGDLCAQAEASPSGQPGVVTNADVATVCKRIDAWVSATNAGYALTAIGLAGVATFTMLLFLHRDRSGTLARISPRPGGLSVRF